MPRSLGVLAWPVVLAALLALTSACDAPDLPPEIEGFGLTVERDRLAPALRIFNFPDYLDEELIREFREAYGVRIIQDFFDTNEAMLARMRAAGGGQFDLVVASDYAVQILAEGGLIAPLDTSLLPNRENLHPDFTGLPYDPDNHYSIPYQWGTTGIGIRGDRVAGDPEVWATWALLFDAEHEPGRFALLDDPRESIGAALLYLGHSVNATDPEALADAEAVLVATLDRAVAFTPATTGRDLLIAGELDVSHNHSGDIAVAAEERPEIVYVVPEEGAVVWADNMVVPGGSPNVYTAHVFMNFILDARNGARLTEEIGYYSPNRASWELLDDAVRTEHERLMEPEVFQRFEFIEDVGTDRRRFDEMWTRVKAGAGR